MEYVYAAMLLHSAKKEITEDAVKKVLDAAGIESDASRIKALVASLKDVNIEEAIEKAAVSAAPAAAAPAQAAPASGEAKAEEPEEDKKKHEEEAAAGLGSLFG